MLLNEIYSEQFMQHVSCSPGEIVDPTDELYVMVKSRIDDFYIQHGDFYEDMVSRIPLTELGRQYKNGTDSILCENDNQLTPT